MRGILACLILIALLAAASAIKCYDCESLRTPQCNRYFSPLDVTITDCDEAEMPYFLKKLERREPATGCITKIHEGFGKFSHAVRRTCYFGDISKTEEACAAEDEYFPYAKVLDCTVCEGDLCNVNAGEKAGISCWMLLIMLIFSFILRRN